MALTHDEAWALAKQIESEHGVPADPTGANEGGFYVKMYPGHGVKPLVVDSMQDAEKRLRMVIASTSPRVS